MADEAEESGDGSMATASNRKSKSMQQQEVEATADDGEDSEDNDADDNGKDQHEDECEEGIISTTRQNKGKGVAVEPTTPVDTDYEIDPSMEAAKVLTVDKGIFIL